METHHGASNHFGHQDFYAAKAQGKSITEIADWFRANPTSHMKGLNSLVYQDIAREEQQYLAQQRAKQQEQQANQISVGGGDTTDGISQPKPVEIPGINRPGAGEGTVSPHDFASDYMKKIMDARNNGQDPLRYDKEAGRDTNPKATHIGKDTPNPDNPYDNQRYKQTGFEYDKDALNSYKSPQYTG